jgi:hypothetical protein
MHSIISLVVDKYSIQWRSELCLGVVPTPDDENIIDSLRCAQGMLELALILLQYNVYLTGAYV